MMDHLIYHKTKGCPAEHIATRPSETLTAYEAVACLLDEQASQFADGDLIVVLQRDEGEKLEEPAVWVFAVSIGKPRLLTEYEV